jgi:hypothetical protein
MTTDSMTTITLTLTPYQEARLTDALAEEVRKWHYIAIDARSGARPNADPVGADLLKADSQAVLDAVREGLAKTNR